MRVTVNFSLKRSKSRADGKCPVYVRCTINNQRFELSTGVFVVPDSWDDERQRTAGRTEETKILNNRLDKICTRVQDIYNQLESKGEPFSALKVKNRLLGVSDEKGVLEILDGIINDAISYIELTFNMSCYSFCLSLLMCRIILFLDLAKFNFRFWTFLLPISADIYFLFWLRNVRECYTPLIIIRERL